METLLYVLLLIFASGSTEVTDLKTNSTEVTASDSASQTESTESAVGRVTFKAKEGATLAN